MNQNIVKLGALLFLSISVVALSHAEEAELEISVSVEEGVPGHVQVASIDVQAKVISINHEFRVITLLMPSGKERSVLVAPETTGFAQIQVDDMLDVTLMEENIIKMESETEDIECEKSKGMVLDSISLKATVVAINYEDSTATLKYEDGSEKTHSVREDIDLSKHYVGETVVFEMTQTIQVHIEK